MDINSPRILFITSLDLSSNPRLRKEVELLASANFKIALICQRLRDEGDDIEAHYLHRTDNILIQYLDCRKSRWMAWVFCTIIQQIASILVRVVRAQGLLNSFAEDKFAVLLWWRLRRFSSKKKLIVCHTLTAFHMATVLSERLKCPLVIDVEDYHPGEQSHSKSITDIKRRERLLRGAMTKASLTTFSSPLIAHECEKLIDQKLKSLTLLNVFPNSEFETPVPVEDKIKFVWFSQHVDYGRGLEKLFDSLDHFSDSIVLHLIGNLRSGFKAEIGSRDYVNHHDSMNQQLLYSTLSSYQVGLAIEDDQVDFNRQLCITNKLLAYIQAGVFVLYSDTPGQLQFMENHKDLGFNININDKEETISKLKHIIDSYSTIEKERVERFHRAKVFGWEYHSATWLSEIKSLAS